MSQQAQCEDYDLTPESRRDDTTGPKFSHQQTVVEPGFKALICAVAKLWCLLGAHTGMPQGFQRGLLLARRSQYPSSLASEAPGLFIPEKKRTSHVSSRAVATVPRQAASPLWSLSCHLGNVQGQ